MKMSKCPDLVFSTRHPIKAWDEIQKNKDIIPDLDEIIKTSNRSKASANFVGINGTNTNEPITNKSLYYARYVDKDGVIK